MSSITKTITWSKAKAILIAHIKAVLFPYEADNSEEITFFFHLIPIIMENPNVDIDDLCVAALENDCH